MVEQVSRLLVQSGAAWVLYTLLGMSVLALAVAIERGVVLRRKSGDLSARAAQLRARFDNEPHAQTRAWLEAEGSIDAQVVAAGVDAASDGSAAAESAMAAQIGLVRRQLSRGLMLVGSVGSNAPFVGLLGTVIGVVGAFDALSAGDALSASVSSAQAGLAPERVMSTIGEALVATAVGLFVAIPAIVVFNHFQTRIAELVADAETLGHVLLSRLHAREARTLAARGYGVSRSHAPQSADISALAAEE